MSLSRSDDPLDRRPWLLWALSAAVALTGAANLLLAADHALRAAHYRALGVSYPPLLRALFAAGWGAVLLALAIGMARRRRWAQQWILIILSNYGAFGVLWLVAYAASDFGRERIAFQAVLTVVLLLVLAWLLRRRRIRCRFVSRPDAD